MKVTIFFSLFFCLLATACSNAVSYDDSIEDKTYEISGTTNEMHAIDKTDENNPNETDIIIEEVITAHNSMEEIIYIDTLYDTVFTYGRKTYKYIESKKLDEYPYYEYVDGFWHYDEWKDVSFYNPELFESAVYPTIEDFPEKLETLPVGQRLRVNTLASFNGNVGFLTFLFTDSSRYILSFDKVEGAAPPLLKVTPWHFEGNAGYRQKNSDSIVTVIEFDGRWYYPLNTNVFSPATNYAELNLINEDFTPFLHPLRYIIVCDSDFGYPLDFDINLIIVGKYTETKDGASPDLLAKRIQDRINLALNPGGINVRKANVLYAKDHPTGGGIFPENQEFTAYRGDPDQAALYSFLGKWPGHEGEINLALFYNIKEFNGGKGGRTLGFAPLNGEIYVGGDQGGYVTLTSSDLTSSVVADVAIHELGHFFGLDHTSEKDGELVYDSFDDTPECLPNDYLGKCPDYGYIMFPNEDYAFAHSKFTSQQMDAIRYYLFSHAHK